MTISHLVFKTAGYFLKITGNQYPNFLLISVHFGIVNECALNDEFKLCPTVFEGVFRFRKISVSCNLLIRLGVCWLTATSPSTTTVNKLKCVNVDR